MNEELNEKELTLLAEQNRRRLVDVVYRAKAGHIGGDLSCLNVMTALYFNVMRGLDAKNPKAPERDRFVLSKGHCVEALYVTLDINNLNQVMQAASQQMYSQAGAQPGAGAGFNGGQQTQQDQPKQDDTIQDADFEEVK